MVVMLTGICIYLWAVGKQDIYTLLPDLKKALYEAASESISESEVAVAFSGGVDSSLLAKICHDLGKKIMLVTVGFPGSHDVEFSRGIAAKMGMTQKIVEIDYRHFQDDVLQVRQTIRCENTSHIENCIAYLYIARAAVQSGLRVVLSANGCDELFCGYNGYRAAYSGGEAAIVKLMDDKLANEFALMEEISVVVRQFGVLVRQPFLSCGFIEFAKSIPVDQKIRSSDDMLRKHALRQVALEIGVPQESAMKPKKALQYGSSIHKFFKKTRSHN
jgi:asparagine synthase (glutamine-hydrolysing)